MDNLNLNQLIQPTQLSVTRFVIDLVLTGVFTNLVALYYVRFGTSLSNRRRLANNFFLVAVTTMLVITVVKSSLALSLGLVGALSIVRFRTAVKEPEELAYLFLTISIGLGFGAGQRLVTVVALAVIVAMLYVMRLVKLTKHHPSLLVDVVIHGRNKNKVSVVTKTVGKLAKQVDLRRVQTYTDKTHISLMVEFVSMEAVERVTENINKLDSKAEVSVTDISGIIF